VGPIFAENILKSLQGHTLPAARAREVFKPSMDSEALHLRLKKKIWVAFGVFHCVCHNGRVFLRYRLGFLALGSSRIGHLFILNVFCILDSNTNL